MKKTSKRLLSFFLAIALIFCSSAVGLTEIDFNSLFAVRANAANTSDLTFKLNANGNSYSVTDCNTSASGTLAIPSTYNGKLVTGVGYMAFYGCKSLTAIGIPSSVTSIGNYAFADCTGLTYISIPSSVTFIDDWAFSGCKNLTSITIPDSLNSIEYSVFYDTGYYNDSKNWENGVLYIGKYLLKAESTLSGEYTIKEGTRVIGESAFYNCKNLTYITIPDSVTRINENAFHVCTGLKSITIPDSVISIGDYAFRMCTSLASVTIFDGLESMGKELFAECTSLKSITIPDSVTSIGSSAFDECTSLTSITTDSDNEYYSSVDGILFNKNATKLIRFPAGKTDTAYIIPNSVTSIDSCAFESCTSLNSISIPECVTSIGSSAFEVCTSLNSISIPEGVTSIGFSAFASCTSLNSISIPEGVTSIGSYAFMECTSLTSISIPEGVTNIGSLAFSGCSSLTDVYYLGTEADWGEMTIASGNDCLGNVTMHYHEFIYSDWVIDIMPSCTGVGSKSKTCPGCGKTETEEIPATGHQNTIWITEKEPTCTTDGYQDKWCLDCGEVIETQSLPSSHSYGDWVIDTAPTCIEDGTMHQICSGCGAVKTGVAESKGHSHSTEWTIDLEPTCTEEGSKSHHCTICGDKADVTAIDSLGHDYSVFVSIGEEHPHTITYKCSRCDSTTEEASYSESCVLCNFSYEIVDDETCKITGYIGTGSVIKLPGFIDERVVVTTATGAFKNNTTVTSVIIEDGVQSLGALAFLGCTSLSKVVIPESVTSIGASAFHNCASDFTIYCYRNTYAMQYAIDNSHNYVIMDIGETDTCSIDYENKWIFSSVDGITSLNDVIYVPSTSSVSTEASLISGTNEFFGTGSKLKVTDNGVTSEYTLIVNGDTNGDSVCDALDAAQVICVANGQKSIDGAYKMAADGNSDDVIDIADYQAVINKAVS